MSVLKDVETRLEGLIEYDDLGIDIRVEGSSGFNEDLFDDSVFEEIEEEDDKYIELTAEYLFRKDVENLDYDFSLEERNTLFSQYFATKDPEIKKKLLESNIKLLPFFAGKFRTSLPFMDLVQQGFFALENAIDKFDPEKGKFSTYTGIAINREMKAGIYDQARVVPFPHYVYGIIAELLDIKDSYYKKNGCYPSYEKIASSIEGFDEDKLCEFMLNTRDVYSLYERIGVNEDDILDNYICDVSANTDAQAIDNILFDDIIEGFSDLTVQQRNVMNLMLGLETGVPMIKQQVADYLDISHQRVSQLYDGAIKNLRKRSNFQVDEEWYPKRYTVTKIDSIRFVIRNVIDYLNSNGIMTPDEIMILKLVLGYDGKICSVTKLCNEYGYSVSLIESLLEQFNEYKKTFVKDKNVKVRKGLCLRR